MRAKGSISIVINASAVLLLLAALVALYFSPKVPGTIASRAPASQQHAAPVLDSQIR